MGLDKVEQELRAEGPRSGQIGLTGDSIEGPPQGQPRSPPKEGSFERQALAEDKKAGSRDESLDHSSADADPEEAIQPKAMTEGLTPKQAGCGEVGDDAEEEETPDLASDP